MLFRKKKTTITDMVREWILNPYSIYHDDLKETSSAIKEFNGQLPCISDRIYEITYYDIFKFAHNNFRLYIFQDGNIKSYLNMNIEKAAAVIAIPQYSNTKPSDIVCQLYVYKPLPFTETINIFFLEEIRYSFDLFRVYNIESNEEVKRFEELSGEKDYIFISKAPFKKSSFSCYIIMRYAHNAKYLQERCLSYNNGFKPFKV